MDITSVNDGKNYVYDEDTVSEIGWIWTSETWEDVTLPGNLLRKAKARMQELAKGVTSMELTIVDESDAGADIGDIRARMYVRCISKPHGIDGTYLCLSRTVDYLNPAGNTITIGASGITLSSASAKQDQNISDLSDELIGVTGEIKYINEQKMYRTETYVDGVNIFRGQGPAQASCAAACFHGIRKSQSCWMLPPSSGTGIPAMRRQTQIGMRPMSV